MRYVSLHHHTTYSYQDGYGLPEAHFARVAELGGTALAMTEHGNTSSHVKAELAGAKWGIKPIYGLEAYCAPSNMREMKSTRKWHLILLAMNEVGYHNLNQIVTKSWENFYQWPTVSGEMLKEHNEGIICLSGCLSSQVASALLGGNWFKDNASERAAIKTIKAFKSIFGDRYYLEVQRFPGLDNTRRLNQWLAVQSKRLGVPLVATSDCHYPLPEDNEMQKILHAAGRNIGTVDAAEQSWEYDILLTHPLSDEQVTRELWETGLEWSEAEQAVENTSVIAERCNVTLPKMGSVRYPIWQEAGYHKGMDQEAMLRRWLNEGWKYRGWDTRSKAEQRELKKRVEHELSVMRPKEGFFDYHLAISDMTRSVKDKGLAVGPGRGSAAASYVCYLLRITEIDPSQFPMMMFERYIDPNRADLPDIDLDFDDERRYEVQEHMNGRYGEDHVGVIGSFTQYKGKNSMDDVGRVYEVPKFMIEEAKSFLPERSSGDTRFGDSIADTVEMFPQVAELFDKYPVMNNTMRLEGNYKGMGVHAAGLVVGSEPLYKVLAAYQREVKGNTYRVMSVDKYDGEHLGLLKVDVLGLTTMGMIGRALDMIGMRLDDLYRIPNDDPATIDAFRRADVTGIFQFEGRTTRMVCQEVAPDTFMELADINALSRPGPLHSGQTGEYISIKHGRGTAVSLHPRIDELTTGTHGQIIYQEQILTICREIGQFPWTHAAEIRKIISQKKGEGAFNAKRQEFLDGAESIGVPNAQADKIWKNMVTAGAYAFNVAHCISYAMLAFWAQWLKQHHPLAFYAASLQKTDPNKGDKLLALMRDAQDPRYDRDIPCLGPDPILSGDNWVPDFAAGNIRSGLRQIKGVGEKTARLMVDYRKSLASTDGLEWKDYIAVKGLGKVTMQKIEAFANDPDPFGVGQLRRDYDSIVDFVKEHNAQPGAGLLPVPDTLSDEVPYEAERSSHNILCLIKNKNQQELFENHRSRTGEELNPADVKDPHLNEYMTIYGQDPGGLVTIKVNRWKFPKYKGQLMNAKKDQHWLLIRGHKKPFFGKTIHADELWVLEA